MLFTVFNRLRTEFRLIVVPLVLACQSLPAQEANPTAETNNTPAPNLATAQESIEMRYRRFEDSLVQLREYLRKTDPSRAELLARATGKSNEDQVRKQLRDLTDLLKKDQLSDAAEQQEAVINELQSLLELLMSEARKDEIELEKKRIQEAIKEVGKLIGKQTDARADTERGGNPADLEKKQKQVSDSTKKLADQFEAHDKAQKSKKAGDSSNQQNSADSKDAEGKDGEADKKPAEGSQDPTQPDGESETTPGDKKPGEKKSGDKKPDGKQPSKSGDEKKSGDQKDSSESGDQDQPQKSDEDSSKSDESPPDKSKPGQPPQGKPKSSQPQKGKPQQGKPRSGQPEEDQDQQDNPQEGSDQDQKENGSRDEEPSQQKIPDKTPGREELNKAKREMDRAIQELKKDNKKGASDKQDKALAELMKAKEKLEEILRLLREEEREMVLVRMEVRFRDLLLKQEALYNATLAIHAVPADTRTDRHRNRSVELARNEDEHALLAAKALTLLKEEGSSVAFPDAVEQIHDDMLTIARRLERVEVGEITQNIEQDTIEALREIIEAMQKELEKLKDKKQQQDQQQQQQQQAGQRQQQGLINQLAELKMLRSLQYRVNRRTKQLGRMVDGEQAVEPDLLNQLKQLSDRQAKVQKATYDLATGKTQ